MGTVPTQPTVNHHKCVALWLRNGKTIKRSGRGVRNEALRQCVALLATTSPMTLAAIARTLGVTKQRVYQIASALPDWCGRQRRRAACQEVLKAKALATSRLQAIMESCPFEVKLIPYTQAASGFHLQKVMIEGKSSASSQWGATRRDFGKVTTSCEPAIQAQELISAWRWCRIAGSWSFPLASTSGRRLCWATAETTEPSATITAGTIWSGHGIS